MKYFLEDIQKHNLPYSLEELTAAFLNQTIIEGRALMLDSRKNLHISLGEFEGIMPYEECADGVSSGDVKEIALITRVGKMVCFVVDDIDATLNPPRIMLSRTKAQKMCKNNYIDTLTCGDVIPCKVTHIENFGAFCDVGCGISALAPIDCLSISRIRSVTDRICVGQQINCVVKGRDDKGRLILSLKELLGTWLQNASKFEVGETVVGIVRSTEAYGVFIELAPNLAGLAEGRSDLTPGQLVSVFIKSILPEKMKIKLTILNVCDCNNYKFPLEYFYTQSHIDNFVYSPIECKKQICTSFSNL